MAKLVTALVVAAGLAWTALAAWAFTCPVVIRQAEEMITRAERGKPTAETRPFIDEAKKLLAEARAHHEKAKTKRDHVDAVRKAKFAIGLAESAVVLQGP
ncbi:MAG: hypothetical protein ACREK6_20770 [Candidatus Rokuibacteriota bacterium]